MAIRSSFSFQSNAGASDDKARLSWGWSGGRCRCTNATSEKLAPRSRSFREVFVQFFTFSDVFESFRMRLDLFGCVRMWSDAIGCISVRWEAFRHFWKFSDFSDFFGRFWWFLVGFWSWGLTFTDVLRIGGLTIIGANYWEVALVNFRIKHTGESNNLLGWDRLLDPTSHRTNSGSDLLDKPVYMHFTF